MTGKLLLLIVAMPILFAAQIKPVVYDARSDGQAIDLQIGDTFEVALPENPTTGFRWEVMEGPGDVIEQEGEPRYATNRSDPHLMGGGGMVTFRFKAAEAGTVDLRLAYHRQWEKETPPAKTFHLTVNVS